MILAHTQTSERKSCIGQPEDASREREPLFGIGQLHRSWLQDTLKRKLVDFAWESAICLFTRRVLPVFGSSRKKLQSTQFLFRGACFDQSSGQPRVSPGNQGRGGVNKSKNRQVLFSRHFAANDVHAERETVRGCSRVATYSMYIPSYLRKLPSYLSIYNYLYF